MQKYNIKKRYSFTFYQIPLEFLLFGVLRYPFFFLTFYDPLPNCQKNMLMEYINKEDWGTMALNLVDIYFNLNVNHERFVHTFIRISIIS